MNKRKIDLDNDKILRSENVEYNNQILKDYLDKRTVYSNEEQKIGKWTNGKTLYRKIVTGTVPKSEYYPTVATGITNLDKVVFISLIIAYGDNRQYFSSVRYTYYLSKENENQITIVAPDVEGDATFTIYYTKTTD